MEKTEAPTLGQQSCAVGPGEQEFPGGSRFQPMLQGAPEAIPSPGLPQPSAELELISPAAKEAN